MTNNWITILAFTYPHEAHLAKTKLESEGFEVMIKDELTVQVDNFYSNAIGGVKLQVLESDFDDASLVLKNSGYILEPPKEDHKLVLRLNKVTSKLPFIGNLILEFRLLILVALALVMIIVPIVFFNLPTTKEQIIKTSWRMDKLIYQGKQYEPRSAGVKVVNHKDRTETFFFDDRGLAYLPGFNSYPVNAKWKMEDNKIVIYDSDNFQDLYNGRYSVEINEKSIIMQSQNTTIIGHPNTLIW